MSVLTGGEQLARRRKGARAVRQSPRSRLHVDERRAQLLELGAELFSAHSYDGLSVDDIAQAAGISKGLLYHYFPSKREFYVETIRAAANQLLQDTQSASEDDPTLAPLDRARAGMHEYLEYAERHASAFTALLRGGIGSDSEVFEIIENVRREYVNRFVSRTPMLEPGPDARNAVRGFIGFAEGVVLDWLEHRDVSKEHVLDLLVRTLEQTMTGVLARQSHDAHTAP